MDGKDCYLSAAPMPSAGWSVLSGIEKETMAQSADALLTRLRENDAKTLDRFDRNFRFSVILLLVNTVVLILAAAIVSLRQARQMVQPLKQTTEHFNEMQGENRMFEMEDAYRTGDEIETLVHAFSTLTMRTRDCYAEITRITAEKERTGTELALAARLQEDALPSAFPERAELGLFASMDPAKDVGGDFFDFFLIDQDHLGLVIADVSGKGIPGALFMMKAKLLVLSLCLTHKEKPI